MSNYTIQEIDGEQVKISKRTGKPLHKYTSSEKTGKNLQKVNAALDLPKGQNAKYVSHVLQCQELGMGADLNDVEDLKRRFARYLKLCIDNDMKVGNLAAYCAMGITKDIAFDWEHGRTRGKEHTALIRFVKSVVAAYRESALANGEINPILGMFWQKAFHGLNEMAEYEASNATESASDHVDAQTIADKYQDLLPE